MRIPIVLAAAAVLTLASCSDQPQTIAATSGGQTVDSTPTTEPGTAPIDNTPNESTIPGTRPPAEEQPADEKPRDAVELPEITQETVPQATTTTDSSPPTTEPRWHQHDLAPMILTVDDLSALGEWSWDEPRVDIDEGRESDPEETLCGQPFGDEPPALYASTEAPGVDFQNPGLELEQIVANEGNTRVWLDAFETLIDCPQIEPEFELSDIEEIELEVAGSDESLVVRGTASATGFTVAFALFDDAMVGVYLEHSADAPPDPQVIVDLVTVSAGRRP